MSENPRLIDRELVHRCLAGEAQAERAFYDAHVERVYRLVHRMAGDPDLAADFTQETFIRAFDKLEQFRGDASLLAYHLALDAHPTLGNNAQLAARVGATPVGPFEVVGLGCTNDASCLGSDGG